MKKPEPTCTRGSGADGIRSKNRSNGAMSNQGGRGIRAVAGIGFSTVDEHHRRLDPFGELREAGGGRGVELPEGPAGVRDESVPTAADEAAPTTTAPVRAPAVKRAIAPRCGMRFESFMAVQPPE